ncbi:hypothetical protein V2J09_022782 [Rumex salicifolius]
MDPIMKLLEEDEDDTLHSGAAVEAFTAALNRDIEGNTSISHSASEAMIPQGSNQMSSLYSQWQPPTEDGTGNNQSHTDLMCLDQQAKHSGELDMKPYISGAESQQQEASAPHAPNELLLQPKTQDNDNNIDRKEDQNSSNLSQSSGMQNLEKGRKIQEPGSLQNPSREAQLLNMPNQSTSVPEQASRTKQIPFGSLLPIILPELDKDRAMQLQSLYAKLRKNEIPKDGFVRLMRNIVGDQMLKVAVVKMQSKIARESQPGPTQQQLHSQNPMQQHNMRTPMTSANDPYQFAHLHQRSQDSNGMQVSQMSTCPAMAVQGLAKQQQNMQFPHTSYSMYGNGNFHPYPASAVNASSAVVKPQPGLGQISQGFGSPAGGGVTQALAVGASSFERQHPFNDSKRLPTGSISHMSNNSAGQQNMSWQTSSSEERKFGAPSSMYVKQEPVDPTNEHQSKLSVTSSHGTTSFCQQFEQGSAAPGNLNDEPLERQPPRTGFVSTTAGSQNSMSSPMSGPTSADFQGGPQMPSSGCGVLPGSNTKPAAKKSSSGQKKPLDAVGSSPPLPSKKQKVSGVFSDQSIEHLNDVTAVSGVNLREEEEQLFSGPKDDTRASEASRKVVQEEEDKLILQKLPLQKKLAEIMTKCGLKNLSNDVERCISLCVEERLRGLLSSVIRISRQRVDSEKSRHRTVVTSDVRQQILAINRKAREEWEKEQAEADKLRRLNEPDNATGLEGDKEKDENRTKSLKVNKEEDDKMRTTAANVAARAAVGGDDMLSKWQLMAEQARQKREGGSDAGSNHPGIDANMKNSSTSSRNQAAAGKKEQSLFPSSGAPRRHGRNQSTHQPLEATQNITVKDVIAVLEREPQTSKSTILYRLYERTNVVSCEQNKG